MKTFIALFAAVLPASLAGQNVVHLPEVTVASPRVANPSPVGTFTMPVSALRYDPAVDIHSRNLAEGQADITLRGGIFENTGFQLGALTVTDPQTGHYLAELPVSPAMLDVPEVRTGASLALAATNATVGAIGYGWSPVRSGGSASVGFGQYALERAEIHQGYTTRPQNDRPVFGADVAVARSKSDGSVAFGEHEFDRVNVRLQRASATAQTDLFAGYQGKRFGWPNLYTPFNSKETENLQTTLFLLNHYIDLGGGDFLEAGAYHRRNKDDYAFDRTAALGPKHPFQHTTWVTGAAINGRRDFGAVALNFRAEALADELDSTSLTFGHYASRTITKVTLLPEKRWVSQDGTRTAVKAGMTYDDTNRGAGAFSPVIELAREFPARALRRLHVSYTKTTQVASYTALNSNPAAGLFRGNPDLGRSKAHNVEVGAAGSLGNWQTQGVVFWRRDDALVDWTFRQNVIARTANPVDIDVNGIELIARRSWAMLDVVLGYTALAKDADYRGAAVDGSFYALNYARHRLTAAFTARVGHGIEIRMDNVARLQSDNVLRSVGGDEAMISALGVSFRPAAWHGVELAAQVDNLWDSNYQDVPAVPAARRQFSAGVSYAW